MKQTLLMERVMDQTRLAVIEQGALCELYVRRPDSENLSGNIYLGRVENVLPGMNAAFVDIGLHENGLIHASNMGERGMAVPSKVLRLHQQIKVQVLSVDLDRKRIGLKLLK